MPDIQSDEPAGGPDGRTGSADRHVPVLAGRVADLLAPAFMGDAPVLIDATLGLGGHSAQLLAEYERLTVIGIDRDPAALAHATERLAGLGLADRLRPIHGIYDGIPEAIAASGASPDGLVDAVLFDLGVSSMQLDRADRGFAYAVDAPLDMRMDPTTGITAADVLATYAERDLSRVLRDYGEERFAQRIARAIVARRQSSPITSSGQLVEILRAAIPAATQRTGGHPGKRTFQALRIEVNDELGALRRAIPAALAALRPGGRIVAMSYQSLEDRIVKHAIQPLTLSTTPLDLPVELEGHGPVFRWLSRGSERATEAEIADNPRSAPARLRAAERIRAAA